MLSTGSQDHAGDESLRADPLSRKFSTQGLVHPGLEPGPIGVENVRLNH